MYCSTLPRNPHRYPDCYILALVLGVLAALVSPAPSAVLAQPGGCAPNPTSGCPLAFGQVTQAALTDATDPAHIWQLTVQSPGTFGVVLTSLPGRYRLSVYPPGAERQTDVLERSTLEAGEYLLVSGASPGTYSILVDSPFYDTSDAPYSLLAVWVLEVGDAISSVISEPGSFQPWLVNVPTGAAFSIVLTNLAVDYDLSLFALTGDLVGRSANGGTADDTIAINGLEPGYYLAVVDASGAASPSPYRLAVNAGSAPVASEPPPAPPTIPVTQVPPATTPPPATVPPAAAPPSPPAPAGGAMTESQIAARVSPAVVQIVTPFGLGSGVRIAQGVLTNDHVVGGADRVEVVRNDGRRVRATPLRCDAVLDLALLAADLDLPALDLAPARAQRQGDQVLVLGYPLPEILSGSATLTRGLISAIRMDERGGVVVQTDAAVNSGNSGGAMVNDRAGLIALPSYTSRGSQGINFGIGAESIEAFLAGPEKPCSNGAAPDTVLVSDSFGDSITGALPLSSLNPNRYVTRYLDGEYQIQLIDTNWTGLPATVLPGSYTDASVAIDARVVGTIPGRVLSIGCRDPDGLGGYALLVEPGNTRAILVRYDPSGSGSSPSALTAWRSAPNIRSGNTPNRLELSCVGTTITASINGTQVGSVRDTTFSAGQMWIAATTTSGTVDARFDNLVVTRR